MFSKKGVLGTVVCIHILFYASLTMSSKHESEKSNLYYALSVYRALS